MDTIVEPLVWNLEWFPTKISLSSDDQLMYSEMVEKLLDKV